MAAMRRSTSCVACTTYTDSALDNDLFRTRLELNRGFPIEFLEGMNVLEIGCGQGRFTEHLAKYSKDVVAVDLSYAVYHNISLGEENVTAIRAELHKLPKFDEEFDLVFCRGVLRHTPDPVASIHRLFEYAKNDGLVIFDVYKTGRGRWTNLKYFCPPILQKSVSIEKFDGFMKKHEDFLYKQHHRNLKAVQTIPFLASIIQRTPLYLDRYFDKDYPNLDYKQRLEIAKNEMIDMLYSGYDTPMTPEEAKDALAEIGQRPYSFDLFSNHFRCKKSSYTDPISVEYTKNGALVR